MSEVDIDRVDALIWQRLSDGMRLMFLPLAYGPDVHAAAVARYQSMGWSVSYDPVSMLYTFVENEPE